MLPKPFTSFSASCSYLTGQKITEKYIFHPVLLVSTLQSIFLSQIIDKFKKKIEKSYFPSYLVTFSVYSSFQVFTSTKLLNKLFFLVLNLKLMEKIEDWFHRTIIFDSGGRQLGR